MTRKSTINRTLKLMLTLVGVWPGTPCVVICRAYWIIALLIDEVCHYRYLSINTNSNDLFDLMDCVSSFLTQVKFMTKLFIFWWNEQKFIKILMMMAEDWHECGDDVNIREKTYKIKLADFLSNMIFTLHALTVVGYSGAILLADTVTDDWSKLPLILKVNLPVKINTKLMYKILLNMQFVHLVMSSCGTGILNALLLALILHLGGQIDILRRSLTELVPQKDKETRESVVITTGKIIRKHQRIIGFSECIEDLYTYITLVQFVSNTILICSLGFLIVTSIGNPGAMENVIRSLLFYFVTNLEAFIFCFAGEYLNNKSRAIGMAVYNSAWYELKPENSRTFIFIILRAQKQLTLTVGKIMDLSLESFTSIMKASGSYLSVLLAMQ